MQQIVWLALGYNVPINPSKNRVYVWRKLKEYGACYFKQGVAILPKNSTSMAQMRTLSTKIRDMGGEATLADLKFIDKKDEAETIARFLRQSEVEYLELIGDCANLMVDLKSSIFGADTKKEQLRRMKKKYLSVKARDYFKIRTGTQVAGGLEELVQDMASVTDELSCQLRIILEL